MNIKKFAVSVALVFFMGLWGCSLEEPDVTSTSLSSGTADFSSYVAVGNSLTAGYQSGALTAIHQEYSFPNLIAKQMETAFVQPLIGYPGIGAFSAQGEGISVLTYLDNPNTPNTVNPDPVLTNEPYANYPSFNPLDPYLNSDVRNHPAPYNNLGVPGAVLVDMQTATNAATSASGTNSLFDVVLRNPTLGNTTVVQQAGLLMPTIVTCWIGNNDVLGYATSGGTFPPAPTPVDGFTALYGALLDALQATGADVVVANIPDVTTIPFFTTIPPYLLNPETNELLLIDGNPVPIVGVTPGQDLVLLTATEGFAKGQGIPSAAGGFDLPLEDKYVLDAAEIAVAQTAVNDFNNAIAQLASDRNIPVVDINSFFTNINQNGLFIGGQEFTTSFITGGIFSLDGVHPSDIGHAIVANEFIDVINETYNSTIPRVNVIDVMNEVSPQITTVPSLYNMDARVFKNAVKLSGGQIN